MKLIPLTQGKFTMVDDEDFEWLNQWSWRYVDKGCASRMETDPIIKKQIIIYMSRFILNAPPYLLVDHEDRDKLNNQRYNLRFCVKGQNNTNRRSAKNSSSIYLGVSWAKNRKKWRACIRYNKKAHSIGYFSDEKEAARAYDLEAIIHHGEFANLNLEVL